METLENIEEQVKEQIDMPVFNREQRRKLQKKMGKQGKKKLDLVGETARKLNYIDLIQRLRVLNEEKEQKEE